MEELPVAAHTTRRTLGAIGQVALGAGLLFAGTGHLTKLREEFQAQVPDWFPADPDTVVVASGIVELALGAALVGTWKQPARAAVGGDGGGVLRTPVTSMPSGSTPTRSEPCASCSSQSS
jgi:hypothetical protein